MRRLALVLGVLACAGCTDFALLDGGAVVATDKTIGDHVVSLFSGKNCSTVRAEQGFTYCEEDEPRITPAVHCYRTLGTVTCYDQPDPTRDPREEVGLNQHNTKGRAR
ncbi:MAG: hypothetical protein H6907_19900 [Hyphomicrobiales bacterium]|nr:hypothetical protein [Hyphomicrobiales bacterium]MCP5374003.1 hypothetical protein [Hyphomicrobiales bacterium]